MKRALPALVLVLVAGGVAGGVLASCGTDPKECADMASAALAKGDTAEALKCAEAGLKEPSVAGDSATSWRLERVRLEALAMKGDSAVVLSDIQRLGKTYPAQVTADVYAKLSRELMDAGKGVESLQLVEAGKKLFPDHATAFDEHIAALKKKAEAGDNALLQQLQNLGYVGGK